MNRLAIDHGSAGYRTAVDGRTLLANSCRKKRRVLRSDSKRVVVRQKDSRVIGAANFCGVFSHNIQNRLKVRRRAGDDAQDLARRSLLLQRFLEFLEKPHVLNSDDRLVGEGFKELDLRSGKGANLHATRVKSSDQFSLLAKGD